MFNGIGFKKRRGSKKMLDDISRNHPPERPTWEDIEATLQYYIKNYSDNCISAVKHNGKCFVSTTHDIQGICAMAGNQILRNVIDAIIVQLDATDPTDIAFKQFIKRLQLRRKDYELVSAI
ncbi:hypothetical protein K2P47_01070 [Patescibacteria group bacterium]|nr:hypothetical protein [Patescibacteria group bacterium]